ncbi:hypothetical protein GJ744_000825 [Endocarpon pusillum]|uniref:ATPase inhibitor, mitochondrial n=1 Tax=Endocarpon pusillum TaxID=364733 RepID=A0A8H7AQN6_9EURO|nr:hypothetical protein GJ744_000825 [Endocarpon pusillum]
MLRQNIIKVARANTTLYKRSFSMSAVRAAEGDVGATRSGGTAATDAFNKREQAEESRFIRQKEMESLRKLKEKLQSQRKYLDELDGHIKQLENEQGRS